MNDREKLREKLIELIGQVQDCGCDVTDVVKMNYIENITLADYLISNGVTVRKPINTKADRIRSMSDREMASFFADKVIDASLNVLGSESEELTAIQIEYEKQKVMYHILQELITPAKECE